MLSVEMAASRTSFQRAVWPGTLPRQFFLVITDIVVTVDISAVTVYSVVVGGDGSGGGVAVVVCLFLVV